MHLYRLWWITLLTGFVSFKICYKIVNCALDGVDICINWSNMVNLLLNDNLTALRQSVKFGVHDLRKFFLFFICYSRECWSQCSCKISFQICSQRITGKYYVKAVIMDLKQCLKWLINACIKLAYPNSEILVRA